MSHYTALLDANVLYPAPLRDILVQLALMDLYPGPLNDVDRTEAKASCMIAHGNHQQ
jgi:hypothetical protein